MMWIAYAVKHNVKVLDVEVAGYDRSFLPHCIFACPSLQELNLQLLPDSYGYRPMLPCTINLPSLRKLTLADVEISQVSLNQIIAQSPGLEDLDLTNCARYFNLIDSKVLKRLSLNRFYDCIESFTVAAPQLIYFKCIDFPLEDIAWRGQPSLESAHIETNGDTYDAQSGFTGIISHAKRLELNFDGSDVKVMLEKELPTCSVFENLEFLQISDWCMTDNLYIILCFLQLSPRLQKFVLKHGKLPKAGKRAGTEAMLSSEMTFQCPHLQKVIIHCSKGDEGIDTRVNAMVANGVSLEKIQITFYEDIEAKWFLEIAPREKERRKQFGIFEKTLKENPEWVDNSNYAGSDSDNSHDDDGDDDDELGDEDEDAESEDEDDDVESGDENGDDDKMEDEDDEMGDEDDDGDETEDEDDGDDDMEEDGVNEHDNDDL